MAYPVLSLRFVQYQFKSAIEKVQFKGVICFEFIDGLASSLYHQQTAADENQATDHE